jgi:hypothetical protein
MMPTTPIVENHAESGAGLWSAQGLWHLTTAACEVNQHTGTTGWYYGLDGTCSYDDPNAPANSGSLGAPRIPSVPADARLDYWYRRQTDGRAGFDVSKVQVSTSGAAGPYSDLQEITDTSGAWRYAGVTGIAGLSGQPADLRFNFDTVDDQSNANLGWMVDDIQVTGCNAAIPGSGVASAVSFVSPSTICVGGSGVADSIGSFCGDGATPTGFQWMESGTSIPGATSSSYTIPTTQPVGSYAYSVTITCPGGSGSTSTPSSVSVVSAAPGAVGPTLTIANVNNFSNLQFNWSDIPLASDYEVFESATKNGTFTAVTGTSASGATGLTVPVPAGDIVYYLVAGRSTCGVGPIH